MVDAVAQDGAFDAIEADGGVHVLQAPGLDPATEQPRHRGRAERTAPAVADQMIAHIVLDRHLEVVGFWGAIDQGADLRPQGLRDDLVGVDLQDPVSAGRGHSRRPARTLERKVAADHTIGVAAGDGFGPIGAAIQEDHDLVGEGETLEARLQHGVFVVGAQHHRQRPHPHLPNSLMIKTSGNGAFPQGGGHKSVRFRSILKHSLADTAVLTP